MLIKSLSRKSGGFGQLIDYISREKAVVKVNGKTLYEKHLLLGNKKDEWIKQFKENESLRLTKRDKSNLMYHELLSWHGNDREVILRNPEMLRELAREYLNQRAPDSQALAFAHQDKEHVHLHCMISGLSFGSGRSNRISKEQFRTIKENMERFQREKYPEIKHSSITHNLPPKSPITDKEHQIIKRGKSTQRQALQEQLEGIIKNCNSKEQFYRRLEDTGLKTYSRGGKVYGVEQENERNIRFKSIGIEDKLNELDKTEERLSDISSLRNQGRGDKSLPNNKESLNTIESPEVKVQDESSPQKETNERELNL